MNNTHPEICPICKGSGKYREYRDYVTTISPYFETVCHGCQGKGWIVVPNIGGSYDETSSFNNHINFYDSSM